MMKVADMLDYVPAPCHVIHVVWLRLELKCEDMMAALFSGCAITYYYVLAIFCRLLLCYKYLILVVFSLN